MEIKFENEAVLDVVNNPLNIKLDKIIEKLPPVTPKPRTGHWINDENIIGCYYCSECGGYNNSYDDAYCKYCGAKMEGDNNGN